MSIFRQPLIQNPPQNLRRRDSNFDSGGDWVDDDKDDNDSSSSGDGGDSGGDGGD